MNRSRFFLITTIIVSFLLSNGCSIKKMALNQVANALTTEDGGTVFTGDNDPELIAGALPFAIKMYESLMVSAPWHQGLQLKTGSLYIMYANAFIQTPADMLTDEEKEQQDFMLKRAKNLYVRGRDIILKAIEQKHPGFMAQMEAKKYDVAFSKMKKEDVPFLYWGAAGWLAAYAIDPFDMKMSLTVPNASEMMKCVARLDEGFDNGSVYDFYTLYYGAMPESLGGSAAKAREYFQKAVDASKGKKTSHFLSLATTVSVNEQNLKEFKELLNKVLEVNPDVDPQNRLVNILNQRKATWLLKHLDNFFVESEETPVEPENKQEETGEVTEQNN